MRTRASWLAVAALAVCGMTQRAEAQWWNNDYPSYHASTPAEGYFRGMGAFVQSAGAANLMNSMAAQNYEQARSMELDNRLKGTQTYFAMRQANFDARRAERDRLRTRSASEMPVHMGPPRAAASQVDPSTGKINWPAVLAATNYQESRDAVEAAFMQRAELGQLAGDEFLLAQNTIQAWLADLRANIRNYRPTDYMQAVRFLEMLGNEARMPNG